MSFRQCFMSTLLLLTMAGSAQAAQYADWPAPTPCIFGMPVLGQVVMKGNTGLIPEILKAVFSPEGYELVHTDMPYERALNELAAGNIHCTLDLKNHLKGLVPAKTVIAIYKLSVASMRTTPFKSMNDLAGKTVAFMHGYDIQRLLPVKIKPQTVYDLTSAIHLLDGGHVQFVIDDNVQLEEAIHKTPIPFTDFEITLLRGLDVVPVFSRNKEGRHLREIYDRRMPEMIASGELQRIMQKNGLGEIDIQNILKANGH